MAKAQTQRKPKSLIDSFRLRMIYGKWYIIYFADTGATEVKREGPLSWNIASQQIANCQNDGLIDLDRLSETQVSQ